MILIVNNKVAHIGMEVSDFRGNKYILTGWREPGQLCGGRNGKVYCQTKEDYKEKKNTSREFYPSVIDAKFITEEEKQAIIDGVELAIDYHSELDDATYELYCSLTKN